MPENTTFHQIRKEYADQGIDESELPACPMSLFGQWYQAAQQNQPGDWVEANAMSLATCDHSGRVSSRYVLMKGIDDNGIRFYTNYESTKGRQIAENSQVAAVFHWDYLGRQVRIEGAVEKTTREDSEAYFRSRPRGSQIAALVSTQSSEISSRDELARRQAEAAAKLDGQPVPLPDHWGGYRIVVQRIEFWQGRANRMHDRAVYDLNDDDSWNRRWLAP